MDQDFSELELKTLKQLQKAQLTDDEVKALLKQIRQPNKTAIQTHRHNFSSDHIRVGLFGDSHIGHKAFDEDLWMTAVKYWEKNPVDVIYHSGDVIEGMSNREGHIYELDHVGVSAQIREAARLLGYMPNKVYGITGNHDGWANKKSNQGVDVGDTLQRYVPNNYEFLGHDIADIILWDDITFRLLHPGDGTSYAISYKTQKRIDSLQDNQKPDVLAIGHYHKSEYIFYRNIHAFQTGTICGQTPFMMAKGLQAHKGFWTLDIYHGDDSNIERLNMEFFPGYD